MTTSRVVRFLLSGLTLLMSTLLFSSLMTTAEACPFCSSIQQTLTQEIASSDVVLVATLVVPPSVLDDSIDQPLTAESLDKAKATFEVVEVLRGKEHLKDVKKIRTYVGSGVPGTRFLLIGTDPEAIQWRTPIELSDRALEYVNTLRTLPEKGPKRLDFFEDYLEDKEELLRADSYDEFAQADYDSVKATKELIDRERLLGWIANPKVRPVNRRLYFLLLGVCNNPEDLEFLEKMITSGDEKEMTGLDSMIACYLTIGGAEKLPLIEETFLKNKDAEYIHIYKAIQALRFHAQQGDRIPKQRIVESVRLMLDRPKLADVVITDLARWKDWGSIDRMVQLFEDAEDEEIRFIRIAVVNYLRACPLPIAKTRLEELQEIDPKSVRRAIQAFPFLAAASDADLKEKDSAETEASAEKTPTKETSEESVAAAEDETDEADEAAEESETAAPAEVAQNRPASATGEQASAAADRTATLRLWVLGIPVIAGAGLLLLLWTILRRPGEPYSNPSRTG